MYKLYWSDNTGAFVAHAALKEAAANYVIIELDYDNQEHRGEAFLQINPTGQVPALLLPDGTVVTESVAIVLHIADMFPEAGLLSQPGSTARAVACRWLLYMATNTYMADLRFYYGDRYTVNPGESAGIVESARMEMDDSFTLLDSVLAQQPYMAGEKISIVDTYLVMLAMWHADVPGLLKRCVNVNRVFKEVQARPAIRKIWQQNFPDGPVL